MNKSTLELVGRATVGIGVCTAVGVACKVTKSGWPLLGLMFIPSLSSTTEIVQETIKEVTEEV